MLALVSEGPLIPRTPPARLPHAATHQIRAREVT